MNIQKFVIPKRPSERATSPEKRKLNKEQCDTIINLYNEDILVENIAKKCGCSVPTVYNILRRRRKENVGLMPKDSKLRKARKSKITDDLKDEVCMAYNEDMTMREMSEKFNLSQPSLTKIIKERRKLAEPEVEINYDEFIEYFFKNDTSRLFLGSEVNAFYEKCIDNKIENWKEYIDQLLAQRKKR